ncbi:MAG: GH92 family glycosyl hydrolase, partial [Faecalibacillus sp.]
QSLLQNYQEGGYMPKWPNPGYTNIMIGTHADSIVAEAMNKGFHGFDYDLAYKAVLKDALVPQEGDGTIKWADRQKNVPYEARGGLSAYKALGYIPNGYANENVSRTIEFAYDDWCVAQVAKKLGKDNDYRFFLNRSLNYKNVINPNTGYAMGRDMDGNWSTSGEGFTEGDRRKYTWFAPQDPQGLLELMTKYKGEDFYNNELEKAFGGQGGSKWIEHQNEPCHNYAYMFDYSGRPDLTQKYARQTLLESYTSDTNGELGNDDCGQMSAWYVFSSMGFYPVNPASGEYMIGSPIFDKVTINNPKTGTQFVITADNNDDNDKNENCYIQNAQLNGKSLDVPMFTYDQITSGGTAHFVMGNQASDWAKDYHKEAIQYDDTAKNPEEDYVPFLGDSTAQIYEQNLALSATASATTHQDVSDGGAAKYANDGKYNTGYVSANNCGFPQSLTYTWDYPQSFNKINVWCNYAKKQGIKEFSLEITKDGKEWEEISTQTIEWKTNQDAAEKYELKFNTVNDIMGMRINIKSANMSWSHYAIRELEVYNSNDFLDLSHIQEIAILTKPLVNVFKGVKYKDQVLEENKDYIMNDNIIILKKEFLKTLERNTIAEIEIMYNAGKNPVVQIPVKDTESAVIQKINLGLSSKVSASSEDKVNDGGTADTLIDNDLNRGWCTPTSGYTLPQELTFNWDNPQSFDEIRLYGNYAQKQAPSNIDIQIQNEKDGDWTTVKSNLSLQWNTSSATAEEKIINLPQVKSAYGVKIIVNECPRVWGRVSLREVKIMTDTIDVVKSLEKDVEFDLELNGCTLTNIKNKDIVLIKNQDYTIEDSKVIIKSSYLSTFKKEEEKLEFVFDKGLSQYVVFYTHGYAVHKEELQELYNKYLDKEKMYTSDSWKNLSKLLDEAKKALDNEDSSQDCIDNIVEKMKKAIESLKLKDADYTKVDEAIKKANA